LPDDPWNENPKPERADAVVDAALVFALLALLAIGAITAQSILP
jgi:hypothetical protein